MKNLIRWLGWTLQACCFVILVYFAVVRGPAPVELVQAKRGLFEFRVSSEGVIRSKTRYTVTAFADGSTRRLTQKIGDEVTKGSIVTEILVGDKYEPIRAAMSGVVSKVFHEGGKIERKAPLIEISDPDHIEVVIELTPEEAKQVHLNDAITITKWGGAEALKGIVTHIGDEGDKRLVTGEVQDVPADIFRTLGNRSQAPVSIQVAKYPDALKLPVGAVFRSKNDWAVFKAVGGRAYETKVTLLNRNNDEVMIGMGVSEGETVINHPGIMIKDSVRVEMKSSP